MIFLPFTKKLAKLVALLPRKVYRRALLRGVAAGVEHEPVLRGLACRTVVDIGANRGQFALAARECFPEAWIYAFEPLEAPGNSFECLFAGDARVSLARGAVSPTNGGALMHVSARDDSSSLLEIGPRQGELFPGTEEKGTVSVESGRLTRWLEPGRIQPPALLKLDVQGYELEALHGCEEILDRFEFAYIECSFEELYSGQALADEVIRFLDGYGFRLSGVYNITYGAKGQSVQADFLFCRKVCAEGGIGGCEQLADGNRR